MLSTTLANRPPGNGTYRPYRRPDEGPQPSVAQQKQLLLQMLQGQLDDSTEFGNLLELQEQIRALQTELAEVKQADDEELDKLLDQNAEMQMSIAQARSAQEQAVQAVKFAGQKIAHLETANAELRVSNRQLKVQADESSSKHATKLKSAEQEASSAHQAALTTQSELQKVQASHDQVASKLSLAEMQLVELQAQRLEGLQAADTVKQQAVQLASSKSQAASALAAQKSAEQVSQETQVRVAKLEANLQESQAAVQQAEEELQKQGQQLQQQAKHLESAHAEAQTLQHSLQDTKQQLQDTNDSLQLSKQMLQGHARQLQDCQQLLQGTEQHLRDAHAAHKAAEAAHHAEVDHLQQDLLLAQQALRDQAAHRHRHPQRSRSRASSQGPSQEAPPSIRHQQDDRQLGLLPTTSRQGDDEAGLSQEVGALRGLLARVAPQLEELVGVKEQMSHLLSMLQPGTSGSGHQQQGLGGGTQAVATVSSPEAGVPSAIVQMAKSPNPFAAMLNAEPPPFPGPMFAGLNTIVNPFSGLNATISPFSSSTNATANPFLTSNAAAATRSAPVTTGVTCQPLSSVPNTLITLSTDVLSQPSTTAPARPTTAVPAGDLSLSLQPAIEAAKAAGTAAAAAPAAEVAMLGTAPLPTDTSAALSQTQAADSAAVPVQVQAADSAAVPVRNASKRKWDAMTRPKTASVTVLTAAAPAAPVPSSSAAATTNSPAAPTGAGTATILTPPALPAATAQALPAGAERALAAAQHNAPQRSTSAILPAAVKSSSQAACEAAGSHLGRAPLCIPVPAAAQLSAVPGTMPIPAHSTTLSQNPSFQPISASEAGQPQPVSQALEAASKALAGKEIAAKLAAGFAQQHRSGLSLTARTLPTNTISSGVPAPINLSEAVQVAAAAAAEKLIRDQASNARLSVQSSGDTHAARMEAIRLRTLARHDVPEPVALPPPPPQPDTPAVAAADRLQPAAQASAAADQSQDSPRTSSKGKSKARRKRGRELPQVPWEPKMPGLTGIPGESAVSGARGRRRTDSPASGDTWDSPGKQQAYTKKSNGSPARHSHTFGALRSARGQGRKSPRGRGVASPRRDRSPQRPSGKAARWEERQPQYADERAFGRAAEREAHRRRSSSGGHSPRRHSSSAEPSAKQASLSRTLSRSGSGSGPEDGRRAGSGGATHRQPSQRSLSLLGPRPSTSSPVVAETGMPLLAKVASLPAHLQGGFVHGASLRRDAPQGAIKPNQALAPSTAEATAAEVAQGGGEVAEEAEEGELEPGERGADWESDPEEQAGSQAEPAEASGTKQPSITAAEAVSSQQGVDNALPASQHMPPGAGTVTTQRPDLAPAPQSGYHSVGKPAAAVGRKAAAVKSGQAISGGSQSTVSQKSATKGGGSTEAPAADSHPPCKRSRLSTSSTVSAKTSGVGSKPSSTDQPTQGSSSGGTPKAAGKGVTEVGAAQPVKLTSQKAATSGSGPSKVALVNPPGPPPGSPTASSTIQQVVPPPPPAIPLPPQLQSPSSLRTQPAALYDKQLVSAAQAPAQPGNPVSQQLPGQHLRQQAARQPLLPAGVKPMGPVPVTHAPQRSHVTHTEQQDPPQVQLPASLAPGNHAVQQHAVQPLQAVPAHPQVGHGTQQQSGVGQQHQHRQPPQGLAGQQQPGLMSQQHGQAQSGMHHGAAELQAGQRQLQHEWALLGQLQPAQLFMGQQEAGQFHAGQPHPWQQQQQGGVMQQMGSMQVGQQGGGFQAGAKQGPQRQQGNPHPAFLAGFMQQRGPSPGGGSGPHMQGHHHDMPQPNEGQQMMQVQGMHTTAPNMYVQAQHTQQRPMMSQISRAMAPSSFAQAHFGAFPQQQRQYHQELQLPPPVSLSQPLFRHSGGKLGSLQGSGENKQQLPAGMQPPWQRPTFPP
ncbi:hypothetical protein WJX77_002019 [Trebouxia sp. C0004]